MLRTKLLAIARGQGRSRRMWRLCCPGLAPVAMRGRAKRRGDRFGVQGALRSGGRGSGASRLARSRSGGAVPIDGDAVSSRRPLRVRPALVALALGCTPVAEPAPVAPMPPTARRAALSGPDPQALYAACRARVEGEEAAGECAADRDCAPAGCGGEVCVGAAVAAAGVMTTCEQRPCFQALDQCTCQQGQCRWTVKATVPAAPPHARPGPLRARRREEQP